MTDRDALKHLHSLLKKKGKWYIDTQCPDVDVLMDLCELAKEEADSRLSELSFNALYLRYEKWRKSDPLINPNGYIFDDFLNDTVWEFGSKALKGNDKELYRENCYLFIKFI
jgi:hypothetical protein